MKLSATHHLIIVYILLMGFHYTAVIAGKPFIVDENEIVENTQALFIFLGMLIFAGSLLRCHQSVKAITFCGFLFFLTLLLREVDVESFSLAEIWIQLGSGHGRNIILLSLWSIALAHLLEQPRHSKQILGQLFHSSAGKLYVLGGMLLLLGEFFDVISHYTVLYEELSELIGYYFMLAGAVATPGVLAALSTETTSNARQ